MGVYIFQSRHAPYIKVGHYSGQNAYSRVAHRGFYSCVCPNEISDRVSVGDLDLLAWFPSLTRKDEASVKKQWRSDRVFKSEWFPIACLDPILAFLLEKEENQKDACDLDAALQSRRRL
jgi:hypothetical protein